MEKKWFIEVEMEKKLRIKLVRSFSGRLKKHLRTVEALGLHKIGQVVEKNKCPQIEGMIQQVRHLVETEEV